MTALYHDLKTIRTELPRLADLLRLEAAAELASWCKIVDIRLLARFDPEFPLVAAICGGGSSGKSTLFNSLLSARWAPTGGRAGMNRRVLFSAPEGLIDRVPFIAALAEPFAEPPAALQTPDDLLSPGGPLYVAARPALSNLILMDTPDFDTGAQGEYTNRLSAQGALEASDILIYIFTNANYNNRDNTDFIARMLTGIGRRKCFLVYRVYPSFTAEEVTEHAMTVARNIYGGDAERYVLGIYRADEDNQVAAGERFMALRPVGRADLPLAEALQALPAPQLRQELHASTLADALGEAESILNRARASLEDLQHYSNTLLGAQSLCVREALRYFPMERAMRRFAKIWAKSDPPAVKLMRRTGSLIEFPLKAVIGAAGWAREKLASEAPPPSPSEQFAARLEENLVSAATNLHQQALSPHLPLGPPGSLPAAASSAGRQEEAAARSPTQRPYAVSAHPAVRPAQERLQQREFASILQAVIDRKEEIGGIGVEMENELRKLADHFRSRMGLWDKVGQTFWAFLNVLPGAAAVTYVLSTGDPVGGAAIKVKLAGLFGLKDLYALVAIPVTRGMKKADQTQIKAMLGPVVQSWLNHKLSKVQDLFEQEITGDILRTAQQACSEAERKIAEIHVVLERAREGRR